MDRTTTRAGRSFGRHLSDWLPVVAWAALIFALSAQSDLRFVPDAGLDWVIRKLGHMGAFAVLALLIWRAFTGFAPDRRLAWSFVLAVSYAATDEVHQGFVAGRHPSLVDVGIDATGMLIALVAVGIITSRRG